MVTPFNATEVPEPTGGNSLTSDLNIYYEVRYFLALAIDFSLSSLQY